MIFGWSLLLISFVSCLHMKQIRPMTLFRQAGLHPPTVALLLHSTILDRSVKELVTLLNHQSIPFDQFYNLGCNEHMTRERFKSIVKLCGSDSSLKKILLPVNCLARLRLGHTSQSRLSQRDYMRLGPSYLFDDPLTEIMPTSLDHGLYYNQLEASSGCKSIDDMPAAPLPSCIFLQSPDIPNLVFLRPTREYMTCSDHSWMLFHWSCFPTGGMNEDSGRLTMLLQWVLREKPVEETVAALFTMSDISNLMRWVTHISLIALSISKSSEQNIAALTMPRNYLINLETAVLRRMNDMLDFWDNQLQRTAHQVRLVMRVVILCISGGPDWPTITLRLPSIWDSLNIILNGLSDEMASSWTLNLAVLYLKTNQDESIAQHHIISSVEKVSTYEQMAVVRASCPSLRSVAISLVRNYENLQDYILIMEEKFSAIPFEFVPLKKRMKRLRSRFISDTESLELAYQVFYRLLKAQGAFDNAVLTAESLAHRVIAASKPYATTNASSNTLSFPLLTSGLMGQLALGLAVAALFKVNLGFTLDKHQLRMIFSGDYLKGEWIDSTFPKQKQILSDRSKVLQLNMIRSVAHQFILPKLLPWRELKDLFQLG